MCASVSDARDAWSLTAVTRYLHVRVFCYKMYFVFYNMMYFVFYNMYFVMRKLHLFCSYFIGLIDVVFDVMIICALSHLIFVGVM
jgi:hypothetical protein